MPLENKLKRKTIGRPSDTSVDENNAVQESNPLNNLIPLALAGAGLGIMHKKGMLKPIVKGLTEVAEKMAYNGSDKAYTAMDAIKKWTILEKMDKDALKDLGYAVPKNSIFRGDGWSKLIDVGGELNQGLKNHTTSFNAAKKIVNDTASDVNQLLRMIKENENNLDKIRNIYRDTDLLVGMRELKQMSNEVRANSPMAQLASDALSAEVFVKKHVLSREKELEMMKNNGFRPVMLQDIMKAPTSKTGFAFEATENAVINLDDSTVTSTYKTANELIDVLNSNTFRYEKNGKLTNMVGDWENTKRMILDKNILIDEDGKLIDVRMTDKMMTDFKKSLTTDFKIPGLGFNPLTSLFPKWASGGKPDATFGILYRDSIQPFITKQAGEVKLGDVVGSDILVFDGTGYKVTGKSLEKVVTGVKLNDISRAGEFDLNRSVESLRKMSGLEYFDYDLKSQSEFMKKADKTATFFDAGHQGSYKNNQKYKPDSNNNASTLDEAKDLDEIVNIDGIITEKFHKFAEGKNIYERKARVNAEGEEINPSNIFGSSPKKIPTTNNEYKETRKFIATIEGVYFKDIKKEKGINNQLDFTKKWIQQFFVGRNSDGTMHEMMNDKSLKMFGRLDNVFGRFDNIAPQLAFSTKSKANPFEYSKNVLLKRVLPIYGLTQVPELLNTLSEPIFGLLGFNRDDDGSENKMNINKFVASEVIKPLDIGLHNVKDLLALTKVIKKAEEFTPGFDQINELPGIYSLGISQTKEERIDYIEKGMDPVRKGRYWSLGNTPLTGGKITYWRPNAYRRVAADADFSDSKWGSRQEYYNNTWFPNPVNPLAPLNHFIFDRNHYDKKHYADRPYMVTSPKGSNIPIVGPLFSATIGSIINPPTKMHQEYWDNGKPVEKDDESVALIEDIKLKTAYKKQAAINTGFINAGIISNMNNNLKASQEQDAGSRVVNIQRSQEMTAGSSNLSKFQITSPIFPSVTDNTFSSFSELELYSTPSGNMQLVDIPDELDTWKANQKLKDYSIKKMVGADSRVDINDPNRFAPQLADYSNEKINNQFLYGMGEQYNQVADLFGMKGFETQAFITGEANEGAKVIENSAYAYSDNKDFWDQGLGGLGGDMSEIFRRFVQKRNTGTDYINPIRNTMPGWMPGREYFTDFKHGDPYSKVDNGEERLPGEGYERMWGINSDKMFSLGIGSSYIGKTKEEMMKHLLEQDDPMDKFGEEVTEKGNKMHEQIEASLMESGMAIDTEGKIEDKKNNILGFYDAKVHDITSDTGVAITDIKTVGDKKFQSIVASGEPLYEHKSQVNYYLWATGNKRSNGYVNYVNRDNPEQTYTVGFKFDQALLNENLNTLKAARNEIRGQIQSGKIGRGELYSNLDRFRILADVAPYSDEFTEMKARLSADNQLSAEEQEEIKQIGERVTKQKQPLRLYPYKFKTANLESENVKVKKIIDNNTILVDRYGTEHAIKLAGVHVSQSKTDKYGNTDMTMNDAATKELSKFLKKGKRITIGYDFDEKNKFNKDSTSSIKSVIYSDGKNVNKWMVNKGLATEKDDNSPAAMNAKYSKNEMAVGSAMERITHLIAQVPFVGNKIFQVKSPYEQYRDREVYGKDFQSWNHPIRDYLRPSFDKINSTSGVGGVIFGAYIGSLFGAPGSKFGKLVGGTIGAGAAIAGKTYAATQRTRDKDWIPERREKQSELNEYFDTLKYVKSKGLYEEYKKKALKEDHYDIEKLEDSKTAQGIYNKNKANELKAFKKVVKLDYKHRKQFDFKYGAPETLDMEADKKAIIKSINQELTAIQSDRKIERVPENAIRAISYKQQSEQTMYGYEQGDPLNNLMTALPKKERQYFKYFMQAPEEEKEKILRIAPSYLRRGLQQSWGKKVDEKPSLQEYFQTHGLPDGSWTGWSEDTDIEDVKVKLVHQNKLDMGEFDLWDDQIDKANESNIPIPKIHSQNSSNVIQLRLKKILGDSGYEDVTIQAYNSSFGNKSEFNIKQDSRDSIADSIYSMNI